MCLFCQVGEVSLRDIPFGRVTLIWGQDYVEKGKDFDINSMMQGIGMG